MRRMLTRLPWLVMVVLPLAACLSGSARPADRWAGARQVDGSVVWLEEYRFQPPPPPWRLIDLNERDVSLAFFKLSGPADQVCETTISYAEDPFGSSRELKERARQFFRRHLWAARVKFTEPELALTLIDGHEVLAASALGTEPVTGQRVMTRVYFRYRGERVVAFVLNQWRGPAQTFDSAELAEFDRFVASFRYLRPSFYETL